MAVRAYWVMEDAGLMMAMGGMALVEYSKEELERDGDGFRLVTAFAGEGALDG